MRPRPWRLTKPRLFAVLMLLALLLALLPASWTRRAGGLLQPLGWLQWSASTALRGSAGALDRAREGSRSAAELRQMERRLAELERQVGQQSVLLSDLERQLAEVTGIRRELGGSAARIVRAAVVGHDASPQRQTLTIAMGSLNGVGLREGQWVAAAVPPDAQQPGATGRELLVRQWLIGRIVKVHPYLSRVRLTTDRGFERQPVRVARRLPDGRWQPSPDEGLLLYGLGGGRMQIRHSRADYAASGHTIVLVPRSAELPAPLSVGRITACEPVAGAPLWYNLQVEPWSEPARLAFVYVIAVGPQNLPGKAPAW